LEDPLVDVSGASETEPGLSLNLRPEDPEKIQASVVTSGLGKQHISMTWSAGFAPANQVPVFQFPTNIINGERQRSGDQISPIKGRSFFCGMVTNSELVRISPFCRSANVDSVDWLSPTS
jgi:hypothetical protein